MASHLLVPLALAVTIYRSRWGRAFILLMLTMLVDLDHLLADPIYDPQRCSIDFHPLHSYPAIAVYLAAMFVPLVLLNRREGASHETRAWTVHLLGTGLIVHMLLDASDCWL